MFLGQIILRKVIIELIEAIRFLSEMPVIWTFVGSGDKKLLDILSSLPSARVIGNVTRSEVDRYYREADVFILPTHSDGYAITQLEAAAFG